MSIGVEVNNQKSTEGGQESMARNDGKAARAEGFVSDSLNSGFWLEFYHDIMGGRVFIADKELQTIPHSGYAVADFGSTLIMPVTHTTPVMLGAVIVGYCSSRYGDAIEVRREGDVIAITQWELFDDAGDAFTFACRFEKARVFRLHEQGVSLVGCWDSSVLCRECENE